MALYLMIFINLLKIFVDSEQCKEGLIGLMSECVLLFSLSPPPPPLLLQPLLLFQGNWGRFLVQFTSFPIFYVPLASLICYNSFHNSLPYLQTLRAGSFMKTGCFYTVNFSPKKVFFKELNTGFSTQIYSVTLTKTWFKKKCILSFQSITTYIQYTLYT